MNFKPNSRLFIRLPEKFCRETVRKLRKPPQKGRASAVGERQTAKLCDAFGREDVRYPRKPGEGPNVERARER